jgi:hypothetical protein
MTMVPLKKLSLIECVFLGNNIVIARGRGGHKGRRPYPRHRARANTPHH